MLYLSVNVYKTAKMVTSLSREYRFVGAQIKQYKCFFVYIISLNAPLLGLSVSNIVLNQVSQVSSQLDISGN